MRDLPRRGARSCRHDEPDIRSTLQGNIPAVTFPFGVCPLKAVLPDTEPAAGEGELDWTGGTLRICARTWESCLSYSHAACWSRNCKVTSKCSALYKTLALSLPQRARPGYSYKAFPVVMLAISKSVEEEKCQLKGRL
jgi:hypothetical protein